MHLVSFVCLRAWTGPAGKGAGFGSTKGGGGVPPPPSEGGAPPPPLQPPKLSNTPRGHTLAGASPRDPRFVVWPLELGFGTHNPRFVVWPLELGLGTHNPRFVAWPLVLKDAGFVDYVLTVFGADRAVWVVQAPGDDVEGMTELPGPLEPPPPPPAPKLKVHFRLSRRVFRPPPPHSKARRPPPSRAWKARTPSRNLPWPSPHRRTPVPRSSSVESGARCRMATQQMHLASWSMTSFSSMTSPSS